MMFNNALIVDDHQVVKNAIEQILKDIGVTSIRYAYYCDDALLRLKNAIAEGRPCELLVTDLSFLQNGREQRITDGTALIAAARSLQPGLKVLVFSGESDPAVVSGLFQRYDIDGYVPKGPEDTLHLKTAVEQIYNNKKYASPELQQAVRPKNAHDFTAYDTLILSQLANGMRQKNLPAYLQQQGESATSLSSIEKRLGQIRDALGFTNNEQLVVYCKVRKII